MDMFLLNTIADVLQGWLDYNKEGFKGISFDDNSHVIPPFWPSRGKLKNWIKVLRNEMEEISETPTKPGWYFYEDENYGPAPVYVDWRGFPGLPDARSLDVVECMGEEQVVLWQGVEELSGKWQPMIGPRKDK
jgi:hypothetical protein